MTDNFNDEPQLSEEMEKRLMDLLPLGLDDWLVEDIKHFLATALEEQRKEILSEVLEMVKHQRLSPKDGYFTDERKRHQNSLRAELRTKLNQLKGKP